MHLEPSEQQSMIRNMVREFSEQQLGPKAEHTDKTKEFPQDIITSMAGLGLLGITIPTEYGGAGLDTITYSLVIEELSRRCASTGAITNVHNALVCYPVSKYGTDNQKKKYLSELATGTILGAFAATEAHAGSDLSHIQTTAKKTKDGYTLNGTKTFVTNGPQAGLILTLAKTDEDSFSIFLLAPHMKGITVGEQNEKLGLNGAHICSIQLKDVNVSEEQLLGEEGKGLAIALDAINLGRIGIAAQCVGIADQALEESITYSQERVQFNRPLSSFQAIQNKLADMETHLQAARQLTYSAAYQHDKGADIKKAAAAAKLFASSMCVEAALDAVQIHGGYGYTKEYIVERLYRDSKLTEIYEGTSDMQRLTIAKELLK